MAIRTAEACDRERPRLRGCATVGALLIVLTTVAIWLLARGVTVQTPWGSGVRVQIACDGPPNHGSYHMTLWDNYPMEIYSLGPFRCLVNYW